jgi:hypothetical protein
MLSGDVGSGEMMRMLFIAVGTVLQCLGILGVIWWVICIATLSFNFSPDPGSPLLSGLIVFGLVFIGHLIRSAGRSTDTTTAS